MLCLKLILTSILFFGSVEDHDWKLRKEEDGILVYTRKVEGSSFNEFKAITVIHGASFYKVLNLILDVKYNTRLIPDCTESRILFQQDKFHNIHYFRIRAPWPVRDRDGIFKSETSVTSNGKLAHISISPLGNYLEEKKDLVRMYRGNGYWEVEELPDKDIKITYQFHGDPAGKIPGWLANSVIVSNPFNTLKNLKALVSGSKY
jgi:hypothetical protein